MEHLDCLTQVCEPGRIEVSRVRLSARRAVIDICIICVTNLTVWCYNCCFVQSCSFKVELREKEQANVFIQSFIFIQVLTFFCCSSFSCLFELASGVISFRPKGSLVSLLGPSAGSKSC